MYYPSKSEFIALSQRGNLIPVYRELLADMETPVSAFKKLHAAGDRSRAEQRRPAGRYAFLLESVEGGENLARYSFIGVSPRLVIKSKGREVTLEENGITSKRTLKDGEDPLHVIDELMSQYRFVAPLGAAADLPRFCGGAVGYLGYDMVRFFEQLPEEALDDLDLPDSQFLLADTVLIFDHVKHRIKVIANALVRNDPEQAYEEAVHNIESVVEQLRAPLARNQFSRVETAGSPTRFVSNFSKDAFEDAVLKSKEYIAAGDVFQVVLSQRLSVELTTDRFDVYRALRSVNPSPYMFFLAFDDLNLIGSSPEILVTEDRGLVRTRPLAGTRRRGKDTEEDQALEQELLADAKELAEHIMLVDLGRNDIGRVCVNGSVRPTELMQVERYSHVMHIYSDVVGTLKPECTQFDVLRACFPAGTVSGAPKIRAMEIIDELEPTRRGPYAGAIGYFGFSGNMDTCITIRTIVVKGDTAYVQAGAGIVADSVPEREYDETMNKARALLRAIEMAEAGLE